MVHLSVEQLQYALQRRKNIRNIAVIAHVDHGKTTLTDSLLARAGVIAASQAGDKRATDTRKDEQEKGITIKSTAISLYYDLEDKDVERLGAEGKGFLINLVDSPGHVDFSPEVTVTLRVVDGAMVVVDCVSGVSVQTETVLRQALCERIKPVLMMNKLDRAVFEKALSPEEIYCTLRDVVSSVNALVGIYCEEDSPMGDLMMDPAMGNVSFGSGLHGWGFNLKQFARLYSSKFGIKEDKLMRRLWGENFFNPNTRQWSKRPADGYVRGFNHFVLDPLLKVLRAATSGDKTQTSELLSKLGFTLTSADLELQGKEFMRRSMKLWLPAADAMLDMIVTHLPSPVDAQAYRTEILYEGPLDDEAAVAMKSCDPNGPLMMYVSKMVPSPNEKSRFYAVGRVFSGSVSPGQKVRIMGPDYEPNAVKKRDLYVKSVRGTVLMMGGQVQSVESAPCGNIVGLVGVDRFLQKTGTITTFDLAHNLKVMKFSVSPVMRIAVDVVHPQDLPKLVEGLRRLNKAEPLVQCTCEDGQNIVAGAGELHLDICLKDLEEDYAGVPIKKSDPVVKFCETVSQESTVVLAKSANSLNRLYMSAEPLPDGLSEEIERGELSQDLKERSSHLVDLYNFDARESKKIWCFGPNNSGPNMLVDASQGVDTSLIKDAMGGGFQWATEEGILCGENMRGVKFNLKDATIHPDPAHRGGGQIIPVTRRALLAAYMRASPALLEPVYLVETQCPVAVMGSVMSVLSQRRGVMVEQIHHTGAPLCTIKAHLPVHEAFGFSEELKSQTSGQAFPQCIFDHWQVMPGDPLTPGSKANEVVMAVRARKGLPASLPTID